MRVRSHVRYNDGRPTLVKAHKRHNTNKSKAIMRLLLLAGLVPLGAMAFKSVRAAAKQRNTVNDKSNSNKPKANYNKPKANYNSNSGSDLPDNVEAVERMLRKKI